MSGDIVLDDIFKPFSVEVHKAFQAAMDTSLKLGQDHGLPPKVICVAIVVAAIHSQSLAIIGGAPDLKVSDFDGLLEQDVTDTMARHSARKRLRLS